MAGLRWWGRMTGKLWDKREILEGPGVNFMECEFYIKKEKKKKLEAQETVLLSRGHICPGYWPISF